MIHTTIYRSNGLISAFKLTGHAESGPYGYDLVCAGVSAVAIGSINAVLTLCDIELDIEQGDEGGYLYVAIPDAISQDTMEQVQLLFEGMLVSLKSIETEYKKHIKIHNA